MFERMMISRELCCAAHSIILAVLLMASVPVAGQLVRNPRLSAPDLEAARAATKETGGDGAELVYATRIDAVAKGSFDSLVVILSKSSNSAKEFYAMVVREGKRLPLSVDKTGKALPDGDRFLRIGLRHEADKPPILRIMSAIGPAGQPDERQRNLDFQFNGSEFALVGQSTASAAR